MTRRRFFATVWRINSLAILLTAILAFGVLLFATWQIYLETTRTQQVSNVVSVADEPLDRSKARLGAFESVAGTTVLRAPLWIEQAYGSSSGGFSSGSKETSSVQNYLFYDSSSASAYWLVPGYKGLFLSTHELPEREFTRPERPRVAVIYELVDADSTGDKRLTESDAKVVAVSNPSGSRFTRVLTGVEELNGTSLSGEGRILVLYTAASTLKVAEVDVETHEIVRDAALQIAAPGVKR